MASLGVLLGIEASDGSAVCGSATFDITLVVLTLVFLRLGEIVELLFVAEGTKSKR